MNALERELATRIFARESIIDYIRAIPVPGRPVENEEDCFSLVETGIANHHRLIVEAFERTSNTKNGRLMVFLPPGSAKSTYGSVVFPTWYLGRQGGRKVILASYGDDLARKMGRRARQICRSDRYRNIWKCELSRDSNAAEQWTLTNGGEYMACGILSGITGNRADGMIIDDPIKGREQANSKLIRDKTWDAYQDDLLTRLIPTGWLAIIQTRWHEDDLAGRILPAGWDGASGMVIGQDGMQWEVLCIQAKAEAGKNDPLNRAPGEYLWTEWFSKKHWEQFESVPYTWNSLFQQRPVSPDGNLFKPEQIGIVDAIPANAKFVRGWDLAATKDGGDYTVGAKLGKLEDGRWIIADIVRIQGGPHEVEAAIINTAARDGRGVWISLPQDPGQAGKGQVAYLTNKLSGYRVSATTESGDKVTRAEPLAAQVNIGNCVMIRDSWNNSLISEMRVFPNGTHDDQIDALSRAFAYFILEQNISLRIPQSTISRFSGRM